MFSKYARARSLAARRVGWDRRRPLKRHARRFVENGGRIFARRASHEIKEIDTHGVIIFNLEGCLVRLFGLGGIALQVGHNANVVQDIKGILVPRSVYALSHFERTLICDLGFGQSAHVV